MAVIIASATAVASSAIDAQGLTGAWNLVLTGFSVAESAAPAAAAEVILKHGTSDSGDVIVAPVNLDANGFGLFMFDHPIPVPNGVFVDRVSGSTQLVLYSIRV